MRLDPKLQPLLQTQLNLWQGSLELWQAQGAQWAGVGLQLLRDACDEARDESTQWLNQPGDASRLWLRPAEQLWQQAHRQLAAAQTLAQNAVNQQTTLATEGQQLLADWQQGMSQALSATHDAMPVSAWLKCFLPSGDQA
ncbi:MAG: hypothetical protein JOY84_11940 [Curvibacter sp.]|nr:hypothetical protein [Curvibacter sp.]